MLILPCISIYTLQVTVPFKQINFTDNHKYQERGAPSVALSTLELNFRN